MTNIAACSLGRSFLPSNQGVKTVSYTVDDGSSPSVGSSRVQRSKPYTQRNLGLRVRIPSGARICACSSTAEHEAKKPWLVHSDVKNFRRASCAACLPSSVDQSCCLVCSGCRFDSDGRLALLASPSGRLASLIAFLAQLVAAAAS